MTLTKRVTDLFIEGQEVVLREGEDPVLLWVNKLNSFEMEEARRDGIAARSRLVLALREIGSPDYDSFEAALAEMDPASLVEELVAEQGRDLFIKAVEDIRRDPDWKERLEASERRSEEMTDAEREVLTRIDAEYTTELQARINELRAQARRDLDPFSTDNLKEKYREAWLDSRGMSAFTREFQKTQLYFSVRTCKASTRSEMGAWDHGDCDGHRQRALDSREEVTQLPPGLLDRLLTAVRALTIERSDARFSDALASSSESSAQPSAEEVSTPSTPVATSPELVTTSS